MLTDENVLYISNSNGCKLMGFTAGKLEMSYHQSEFSLIFIHIRHRLLLSDFLSNTHLLKFNF